ncbi:unnamed protein product, partial [Closterium sp. NIES-65]
MVWIFFKLLELSWKYVPDWAGDSCHDALEGAASAQFSCVQHLTGSHNDDNLQPRTRNSAFRIGKASFLNRTAGNKPAASDQTVEMSFWGVEVKAGETVVVDPTEHDFDYIHLSQASLGEAAKDHERVVLKVRQVEFPEDSDDSDDDDNSDDSNDSDENDDDGKGKAGKGALKSKSFAVGPEVVLGVLMKGRVDFAAMDHIFDRQFSLAHTGSHSVFFSGYKTSDSSVAESLYDDDEEIEEDEEEDEEEDSDEDDDEEEEDEEDEAMEGSDDEEAAAAAMAAEKSSKGMAAAAAAAVEKRARIKSGKKGTPVPSPAGGRGAAALATPAAASKQGTPMAARAEGKDSAPRNGKEVTPKKEPVTGSKRASVSIVTPPYSKGKGEKTERKKPRPDTPAAIKTAAKVKPQAAATVTSPQAQKSPTSVPITSPSTPKSGSFPCTACS